MISISDFSNQLKKLWPGVVGVFIFIPFLAVISTHPVRPCEVLNLLVRVNVDGKDIKVQFPLQGPIEVEPNAVVIITAEIKTNPDPEKCIDPPSIDWRLLLNSNPSRIDISEFPKSEVLEITIGTRSSDDDLIQITAKDPSGAPKTRKFLHFKVKGE
jgi:hypothetical protein